MPEVTYEIIEHIGVISTSAKGYTKEVNLIRWNGNPAKVDIRDWSPDKQKMGKGVTLTEEQARELRKVLDNI